MAAALLAGGAALGFLLYGNAGLAWGVALAALVGWGRSARAARRRQAVRAGEPERSPIPSVPAAVRTGRSEEFDAMRAWLAQAPVALVEVGGGNVVWANATARAWLLLDPERHTGQPILWFLPYPSWWAAVRQTPNGMTATWQRDGSTLVWRLRWLGSDATERADGLLWIEDWTERQRVEAMRRDFVANVSHELRTPLTVLIGALETLAERDFPLDPTTRSELLAQCDRYARQMERLVGDLLQLAELEGGKPPAKQWVPVADLLEEAAAIAEALAPPDLAIEPVLPPELQEGALYADPDEIACSLRNLVSNAVRYTPPPGRVTIGVAEVAGGVELFVADTGIGIAPEHLPRLTERFYRVDRARSRASGGTGLGLAIVRHIADRHGAELVIASTVGQGSRFALRFPAKGWRTAQSGWNENQQ